MDIFSFLARRAVGQTLFVLGAASACACGLDSTGLLDVADASSPSDGRTLDEIAPDQRSATDEAGTLRDALTGPESAVDVTVDAPTPVDARAEGSASDASATPPMDAPGDTSDSPVGRPADASADAHGEAQTDAGPSPIIWDGGAIADPSFSASAWADFCANLSVCGETRSLSACMALMPQPSSPDALIPPPAVVAAVNSAASNASDCAAIGTALGDGSACASATADTCSGNSQVTCRWGFMMTIDCGGLGMVCSNGTGNAGCGFGDCTAAQEGATYCVGSNYVARCTSGRYVPALDCQTFGATCAGPAGMASCQGTGHLTCAGGATCVGTAIATCFAGSLVSADCSTLYDPSFSCVTGNTATAACAAGTTCDPATYSDTCAGQGQLNFCNAGSPATYDCTSNWKSCKAGHCTP